MGCSSALGVPPQMVSVAKDREDWQVVYTWDLLEKLHLSRQQARELLPYFEQACAFSIDYYQKLEQVHKLALQTYPLYRDELQANVGTTPAAERPAVKTSVTLKKLHGHFDRALSELERRVEREILTPAQWRIARDYQPSRSRIMREAGQTGHKARYATKNAGKWAQARTDPLSRELESIQEELDQVRDFQEPDCGAIGRFILAPTAADLLYGGTGRAKPAVVREAIQVWRFGTGRYPVSAMRRDAETVNDIKNEVKDWMLINGLHLTPPQVERLQEIGLLALRCRHEKQANHRPAQWLDQALLELEGHARRVFQPGQLKVVDEYATCFRGKSSLTDPVRVGQANDESHFEKWLEEIRPLESEALLMAVEDRLAVDQKRFLGPLTDRQRRERMALLTSIALRVTSMSDVDFALEKTELAKSIAVKSRAFELARQRDRVYHQMNKPGRTARLLFTPGFVRALMIRGRQLAAIGNDRHDWRVVDGPKAEHYEDGYALIKDEVKEK